jgi:hypothetical protein
MMRCYNTSEHRTCISADLIIGGSRPPALGAAADFIHLECCNAMIAADGRSPL